MFSKSVVYSARFLRMPQTSRLLYYDLGMHADDDGVVEAFTVIRMTGAAEDDLKVLVAKGFVRILNEDLVSYIIDWKKNNLIKNDRYHESIYKDLLVRIQEGTQMEPDWNPSGTQMEPEVRLGKVSVDKSSLVQNSLIQGKAGSGEERGESERGKPPSSKEIQPLVGICAYYQEQNNGAEMPRNLIQACRDSGKSTEELRAIIHECAGWGEYGDQCILNRLNEG